MPDQRTKGNRNALPPKLLTRIQAIRADCLDCSGGSPKEVRCCSFTSCKVYPYRLGKRPPKSAKAPPPQKAIRAYYLDLYLGSAKEVRLCPMTSRALWPYRLGRGPTEEDKTTHLRAKNQWERDAQPPQDPEDDL